MSRPITYERYMNMLSERVIDNSRQLKRGVHQRRNGMEDLYGVCFSANGDAQHPARFYISISPDMVYLERFAFKFVIKPFQSSVAGVNGGSMTVGETELSVSGGDQIINGTSTLEDSVDGVTPNPHTHSATGELSGVEYGVKRINTTSTNWELWIDGIDVTDYINVQHDENNWLGARGEGIYPTGRLTSIHDFYDILEVCDMMTDEEEYENRDRILSPSFKLIEVKSDAPFGVDAYLYLKYSNLNR